MDSEKIDFALEIINNKISELMNKFSLEKDKNKSKELENKIDILQEIKDQIYVGNKQIINKVITKSKEGIL